MKGLFDTTGLELLPDISKFDAKNVTNISKMFSWLHSLKSISDISKWDTKDVKKINSMLCECKLLISLPVISQIEFKKFYEFRKYV